MSWRRRRPCKVGGVSGGTVELAGPAYGSINPETAIPGSTLTGNFVAKDPGLVTLTVATFLFDHAVVDTYCNSGADPETGPKDTEIVAEFTVKKKVAANPGTPGGGGGGGNGHAAGDRCRWPVDAAALGDGAAAARCRADAVASDAQAADGRDLIPPR